MMIIFYVWRIFKRDLNNFRIFYSNNIKQKFFSVFFSKPVLSRHLKTILWIKNAHNRFQNEIDFDYIKHNVYFIILIKNVIMMLKGIVKSSSNIFSLSVFFLLVWFSIYLVKNLYVWQSTWNCSFLNFLKKIPLEKMFF